MTYRPAVIVLGILLTGHLSVPTVCAGVIVLSNRTPANIHFVVIAADARESPHDLRAGQVLPVSTRNETTVAFEDGRQLRRHRVEPNGIYCFLSEDGKTRLARHSLAGMPIRTTASNKPDPRTPFATIPVKIVVDDKEPTVQRIWEKRYRQRLAEASKIIERHCLVRFEVVAVGTWISDSNADRMEKLIYEFEHKVDQGPAQLAIGFTGQSHTLREDKHMGGTRGPFCPHILIREWGRQLADAERLEILVHELGHYLGAVHSAERLSVMRPDIGDRQSRARSFQIGFDAENTLAMYLVGEELRGRRLQYLGQLSPATKDHLRCIYRSLALGLPNDPAAPGYLSLLDRDRRAIPRSLTEDHDPQ